MNSPNDKILFGYNRPPTQPNTMYKDSEGNKKYGAIMYCICGQDLKTEESVRAHWQLGHFDIPIYATKQEMMNRLLEGQ